jgi:hypothetical protein
MKYVDKIYFWFQNKHRGYNKGYDDGQNFGWHEGYDAGIIASRMAVIAKLEALDPNMSNEAFQLGYSHALEIARGNVK